MGKYDNNFFASTYGGSTTGSGSTSSTKAKVDYVQIGTTLLNFGTTIYGSAQERKNAEAQAKVLIAQGISQERVQELINEGKRLDLETAKAGVVGGKSGSKTLYIALGISGVLILGVVIFAVTRKKS